MQFYVSLKIFLIVFIFVLIDLGARDETIQSYEAKISKLQMDFEDISAKSAAAKETSTTVKQLEQQLDQLSKERNTLHSGVPL